MAHVQPLQLTFAKLIIDKFVIGVFSVIQQIPARFYISKSPIYYTDSTWASKVQVSFDWSEEQLMINIWNRSFGFSYITCSNELQAIYNIVRILLCIIKIAEKNVFNERAILWIESNLWIWTFEESTSTSLWKTEIASINVDNIFIHFNLFYIEASPVNATSKMTHINIVILNWQMLNISNEN